jgi:type III restriction enzyme
VRRIPSRTSPAGNPFPRTSAGATNPFSHPTRRESFPAHVPTDNRQLTTDNWFQVEVLGLDVFDPGTMETDHRDGKDLPCWLLDTDYNGLCFHVCQAFFPRTAAWDDLKRSLKGQYDDSVWDHLAGTVTPIAMLGGIWEELLREWEGRHEPRPPVFIIVCKNTKIAKVVYEWLAEGRAPTGIPAARLEGFRNRNGQINTIRVDTKVVHETDSGNAKSDEFRWIRFQLDTVGKLDWPRDRQGRPIYPDDFEELAKKLDRPLYPPGRDVRCIVSVGMLTEGWDCNTVTHIIGLRPFMSQLLCEQVVGRGLRRPNYEVDENGRLTEEVAKVLGVPFEIIPFKQTEGGQPVQRQQRWHVHALTDRAELEIQFPRVEGYAQAIRNRVTVEWNVIARLTLDPMRIPPEVEVKALVPNNRGRPSLTGPGKLESVTLNPYRRGRRFQELVFEMAKDLTRDYCAQPSCAVPPHVLFPQLAAIVHRYLSEKVRPLPPADVLDVFLAPYYGWAIEMLQQRIAPDTSQGEAPEVPRYEQSRGPGSTAEVDFWTSREPQPVVHSHINYVVPDTAKWEQCAAYYIDTHPAVEAFAKNAGLGFAIPYLYNGQMHDYIPDFIIRLHNAQLETRNSKPETSLETRNPKLETFVILETKGYDPLKEIKRAAAQRWVEAVNADARYGNWSYAVVDRPDQVRPCLDRALTPNSGKHATRNFTQCKSAKCLD